jgi:hypothetical protein
LADDDDTESNGNDQELVATEVDELTHAELLCLYRDAEENIRFSKSIQWRILGGTLVMFVIFGLLGPNFSKFGSFVKILTLLTTLVGAASICILVIMQTWQGTEREKVDFILSKLSNFARSVYNKKYRITANIERYILLGFMTMAIMIGGFLALSRLQRWFLF